MKSKKCWIIGLLFLFSHVAPIIAAQTELNTIDFKVTDNRIRVSFTFNQTVQYRYLILSNPDRVVVDLLDTQSNIEMQNLNLSDTGIGNIRAAYHLDPKKLRIAMDLKHPQTPNSFHIDLVGDSDNVLMVEWQSQNLSPQPKVSIPNRTKLKDVIIVVDPGHGGKDPGAKGQLGLLEKNVVLAIAKELTQLVAHEPGLQVVLTREGDRYVGLRDRLTFARQHQADMFVSIHADAFKNPQAKGASVFVLSQGAATSEAGRWLAEKNNYSWLGGVNLDELENDSDALRWTLIDLSQSATIGASSRLGAKVLEQLQTRAVLHSQGVEHAGFLVLTSPDMPSILVETGFISHLVEERNLGSKQYRQQLAQAILSGIKTYLNDNPIPGSLFEMKQRAEVYTVVAGDHLIKIAKRQQVSVASLKNLNNLNNDLLKVGQTLLIPPRDSYENS